MLKNNETLIVVGSMEKKERYEITIGSHIYEGRRVWSVYCGNTYEASAKDEDEAKAKAMAIINRGDGKIVHHVHDSRRDMMKEKLPMLIFTK